jgi:5,10-methenyltetrahydromethanopterin hydrogenase
MKLTILKPFRDKVTGEDYTVGATVDFTEERAKEILADRRKLAEKAKVQKAPEAEKPASEKKAPAERGTKRKKK